MPMDPKEINIVPLFQQSRMRCEKGAPFLLLGFCGIGAKTRGIGGKWGRALVEAFRLAVVVFNWIQLLERILHKRRNCSVGDSRCRAAIRWTIISLSKSRKWWTFNSSSTLRYVCNVISMRMNQSSCSSLINISHFLTRLSFYSQKNTSGRKVWRQRVWSLPLLTT